MSDVLILGGSGWLSGHVARAWLDRGAQVTCLARGGRDAPYGAALVARDRDQPDAYAEVGAREWDEVVDISSDPAHVTAALRAIGDGARHWTFISTVSVYAANDEPGADESAALAPAALLGEEHDYSRAKVAAEASVRTILGGRAAIVRPGLIVGAGDPTDRFGYWVGRFALAGEQPVLTPDTNGRHAQVIDVRDLAEFIVAAGDARWVGTANAVGDPIRLDDVFAQSRRIAGHRGDVVTAPDEWLISRDVQQWMGARSLPLWLPREMTGFATRSNTAYRILGGRLRPLRETLATVLADERERGLDRQRRSGLTRDDEELLLAELTG